ncbi:MAG: hypothetical protein R3B09_31735 [Nannocystaceae bacterium]
MFTPRQHALRPLSLALAPLLGLLACSGDDKAGTDTDTTTTMTAGTTTAGSTAGTAATEGTEGTGTDSGTASGTATSTAGTSTTASETTGGGSAGDGMFCVESCENDADCLLDGVDMDYKCVNNFCQTDSSSSTCSADDECIALLSGWVTPCEDDNGCPGQVCVDVGGVGRCATEPSDLVMCDLFGFDEVDGNKYPGGEAVVVCANAGAKCGDSGLCYDPCTSDDDCASLGPAFQHCDVNSGVCGCESDNECEGAINASVCVDHTCQCASDADCTAVPYADTCYQGFCGCSGDAACGSYTPVFDGTMVGCGF